jgi:hypothetical protein
LCAATFIACAPASNKQTNRIPTRQPQKPLADRKISPEIPPGTPSIELIGLVSISVIDSNVVPTLTVEKKKYFLLTMPNCQYDLPEAQMELVRQGLVPWAETRYKIRGYDVGKTIPFLSENRPALYVTYVTDKVN